MLAAEAGRRWTRVATDMDGLETRPLQSVKSRALDAGAIQLRVKSDSEGQRTAHDDLPSLRDSRSVVCGN